MTEKRPMVGVAVMVVDDYDDGGRLLMLKRKGSHGAGTWSVPGGWMEYGESFEETARRELFEETGLKPNEGTGRFSFVTAISTVFKEEEVHSITVWMIAGCIGGEPSIVEPEKCSELGWFKFDQMPSPLFLPMTNFIAHQNARMGEGAIHFKCK